MPSPLSAPLLASVAAMTLVVTASNYLVQLPINDWLTWGALTYPLAFLVTDVTNRVHGPAMARKVVYAGFVCAIVFSILLASPRIALASGTAFLCAQLLDVFVFNRLRNKVWWMPPFVSTVLGSILDTSLFFSLAFAGQDLPWVTWALGDFGVKLTVGVLLVAPFRGLVSLMLARTPARAIR